MVLNDTLSRDRLQCSPETGPKALIKPLSADVGRARMRRRLRRRRLFAARHPDPGFADGTEHSSSTSRAKLCKYSSFASTSRTVAGRGRHHTATHSWVTPCVSRGPATPMSSGGSFQTAETRCR